MSLNIYLKALQAEGIPIQKASTKPLHLEPLFQVEDDSSHTYGRPDHFRIPIERQRYRLGDLPQSEAYTAQTLMLPPYTEPMPDVMDQFAEGFRKVAAHAQELCQHEKELREKKGSD